MIGMHLHEYLQVIILIVDRWITKFLVVIPADNVSAVIRCVAVSDTVISDLLREEIKAVSLVPEFFENIIGQPGITFKQIRNKFLKVGISIQRYSVLQNRGKIVVGGNDIGQISAGQSRSIGLRCKINELDLHVQLIFQILPQSKLVIPVDAAVGTISDITDRQNCTFLSKGSI